MDGKWLAEYDMGGRGMAVFDTKEAGMAAIENLYQRTCTNADIAPGIMYWVDVCGNGNVMVWGQEDTVHEDYDVWGDSTPDGLLSGCRVQWLEHNPKELEFI